MITMSSAKPTPPGRVKAPVVKSGPVRIMRWIGLKRRGWLICGPVLSNGIESEKLTPRLTRRVAFTMISGVM